MAERSIYQDIAKRTGGDIYIGVVGPVRSGKSTFITRFMQELVLPNMTDEYGRERARDEMPQSAAGMTVMTTEPKFVPDQAVAVTLDDGTAMRVKMIDCVGYMIPDALGGEENGAARLVHTPWQEAPMPFGEAAETGTRKVIGEHATIGVLVTSDGTVGGIPRTSYVEAEERLVNEVKAMGKPFAVVLNSAHPASEKAGELAADLAARYGVPVLPLNCLSLTASDVGELLGLILSEFPVTAVGVNLPPLLTALEKTHPLYRDVTEEILRLAGEVRRMGDVAPCFAPLAEKEAVESVRTVTLDMGTGRAEIALTLAPTVFYDLVSEAAGEEIRDEGKLFALTRTLCATKKQYDRVAEALSDAEEKGYGVVMPELGDLRLEKPDIVRRSGGYGVRLRAAAPSIHMIRADIETELNPILGTEQQSEDFLRNILSEFETDPQKLWESNMFGKSLYELVGDGLHRKLDHMPPEARQKLSETLGKIINEGSNGLICILL